MLSLAALLKKPMVIGLSANAFKALFRGPRSHAVPVKWAQRQLYRLNYLRLTAHVAIVSVNHGAFRFTKWQEEAVFQRIYV